MFLPDSFLQLLLALGATMNAPTRASWVTVGKGWLFAGRRTLTGVLVAAGAVGLSLTSTGGGGWQVAWCARSCP